MAKDKANYFETIFKDYPNLETVYKDFIIKLFEYKTKTLSEPKFREALSKLYKPFEQKPENEEGFSRFVYKILIKTGLFIDRFISDSIDGILQTGPYKDHVTQKRLIRLFNEKFKAIRALKEQHFGELKRNIEFEKQGELPWIIYLNFMKILTALSKPPVENEEHYKLSSFFDKHTVTIEELSLEERKEAEVSVCFEFIKYIIPDYSNLGKDIIKKAENKMITWWQQSSKTSGPQQPALLHDDRKNKIFSSSLKMIGSPRMLIVIVLFSVAFIGFSRFNFLGDGFYELTREMLPSYIAGVDTDVFLDFEYKVTRTNRFGTEEIFNDAACRSGDSIEIEYTVPSKCYLAVICVDSKGVHDIGEFSKDKNPFYFKEGVPRQISLTLDETLGLEIYYFLISTRRFSYEKDIKKHIFTTFPGGKTKGPAPEAYRLDLKKSIRQYRFYFNHLKKI